MAQNRIRFQRGLSMPEFFRRFGTQGQREHALAATLWPKGFVCPRCGGTSASSRRGGQQALRLCASCGYQCSLAAVAVMQNTKLPLRTWFMAMQLISSAKSYRAALELMRQLDVSNPTAWLLKHKLTEAIFLAERSRQLYGHMQMDDAFLSSERSGGGSGCGSENKTPFIVAVQTAGNKPHRVCLAAIPHRRATVAEFCDALVVRPVTIVSDGLACFAAAQQAGVHGPVVTGGGRASAQDPRFPGVNIFLGNLKSALNGTFRSFKFAHRYSAEFQIPINRREDLRSLLRETLRAALAAPASSLQVLRAVATHC